VLFLDSAVLFTTRFIVYKVDCTGDMNFTFLKPVGKLVIADGGTVVT
jgi:hypothetical protein